MKKKKIKIEQRIKQTLFTCFSVIYISIHSLPDVFFLFLENNFCEDYQNRFFKINNKLIRYAMDYSIGILTKNRLQ